MVNWEEIELQRWALLTLIRQRQEEGAGREELLALAEEKQALSRSLLNPFKTIPPTLSPEEFMPEPTETPLPALWQRFLDEVAERSKTAAPVSEAGDPYRALQLYLDIEERAVRLAELLVPGPTTFSRIEGVLSTGSVIARHLRTRLGLPADPPNLDSRPGAGLP